MATLDRNAVKSIRLWTRKEAAAAAYGSSAARPRQDSRNLWAKASRTPRSGTIVQTPQPAIT